MATQSTTRERISWLLFESLLIVLSILLAFSVDAWWSNKQEKREEGLIIEMILSELQSWRNNHGESTQIFLAALRDSSEKLIQASTNSKHDISGEEIDQLLGDLLWEITPAIHSVPVLRSVVLSGELGLIANHSLRRDIAEWMINFDRIRARAERGKLFFENQFMAFLGANASVLQIRNAIVHVPGFPNRVQNVGGVRPYRIDEKVDHSEMLSNREFQSLLLRMQGVASDLLFLTRDEKLAELDSLITRLELQAADRN